MRVDAPRVLRDLLVSADVPLDPRKLLLVYYGLRDGEIRCLASHPATASNGEQAKHRMTHQKLQAVRVPLSALSRKLSQRLGYVE